MPITSSTTIFSKNYGIAANAKSETIKRNLKKFSLKSKLSHVTRLDTITKRYTRFSF